MIKTTPQGDSVRSRFAHWLAVRRQQRRDTRSGERGGFLLEIVASMPLLAIAAGSILVLIASSVVQAQDTKALAASGTEVRSIVNQLNAADTCYELRNVKNFSGASRAVDVRSFNWDTHDEPVVRINIAFDKTCTTEQPVLVTITAKGKENGKQYFKQEVSVHVAR